jgi:hypothetical protein
MRILKFLKRFFKKYSEYPPITDADVHSGSLEKGEFHFAEDTRVKYYIDFDGTVHDFDYFCAIKRQEGPKTEIQLRFDFEDHIMKKYDR